MSALLQDFTFALRLLWKDRSFTTTILLTLALCIGGNVAIFTVVYSVLLKPLPVPEADRILLIYNQYPAATGGGEDELGANSIPHYLDRLQALDDLFTEQALYQNTGFTVGGSEGAEQLLGWSVTPSFFRLVSIQPRFGRFFSEDEAEIGSEQRVILNDALWERLYGGDLGVIGREMRLNGLPYEIVGVMPTGFTFTDPDVQLWVPMAFTDQQKSDEARHSNNSMMIGRLAPGATLAQATARLEQMTAAEIEREPQFRQLLIDARFRTRALPL